MYNFLFTFCREYVIIALSIRKIIDDAISFYINSRKLNKQFTFTRKHVIIDSSMLKLLINSIDQMLKLTFFLKKLKKLKKTVYKCSKTCYNIIKL